MLSRKREWQRLWGSDNQGYLSNKRSHQVWHSEGEHSGAREGKRGLVIPMGPISWSLEIQWEKFSQENSMIWFVFWVTFLAAVWRMGFKMARVEAVRRWSQQRKKTRWREVGKFRMCFGDTWGRTCCWMGCDWKKQRSQGWHLCLVMSPKVPLLNWERRE